MGSYDDCGEGGDDEDSTEGEKGGKGGNDGEEDGEEGGTEAEGSEDGQVTPVERMRTHSVELERMGSVREAWAGKEPATV